MLDIFPQHVSGKWHCSCYEKKMWKSTIKSIAVEIMKFLNVLGRTPIKA